MKDYDLNPWTTVMRQIYKVQYDETGVKTLEINKEKYFHQFITLYPLLKTIKEIKIIITKNIII